MFCDILSDGDDAKDGRRHHDYHQEGLMLSRSQVLPISFDKPLCPLHPEQPGYMRMSRVMSVLARDAHIIFCCYSERRVSIRVSPLPRTHPDRSTRATLHASADARRHPMSAL